MTSSVGTPARTTSDGLCAPSLPDTSTVDDGEVTSQTSEGKVERLVDFFSTRLLLKRYRREQREQRREPVPEDVRLCEEAFTNMARQAVREVDERHTLDAMEWLDICSDFSQRWMEVCHWISPKKFREFLNETIGALWERVDEVPANRELPPVDLKWYKYPEGAEVVQPCICPACRIVCNSLLQFKAHAQGKVHKRKVKFYQRKHGAKAVEPQPYFYGYSSDSTSPASAHTHAAASPAQRRPDPQRRPKDTPQQRAGAGGCLPNGSFMQVQGGCMSIPNTSFASFDTTPLSLTPISSANRFSQTPAAEPLYITPSTSTLIDFGKSSSSPMLGTSSGQLYTQSPAVRELEMPSTPEESALFMKIMAAWNN